MLGRALFTADRWKEAAEVADRAIEAAGDDYNVYVPYMNAFASLNETEAATKMRKKQVELVPEDVRARILLAGNYAFFW